MWIWLFKHLSPTLSSFPILESTLSAPQNLILGCRLPKSVEFWTVLAHYRSVLIVQACEAVALCLLWQSILKHHLENIGSFFLRRNGTFFCFHQAWVHKFLSAPCSNPEIQISALVWRVYIISKGNLEHPSIDLSKKYLMWYVLHFLPSEMHILRYREYYPPHFLPDHQGPLVKYKKGQAWPTHPRSRNHRFLDQGKRWVPILNISLYASSFKLLFSPVLPVIYWLLSKFLSTPGLGP